MQILIGMIFDFDFDSESESDSESEVRTITGALRQTRFVSTISMSEDEGDGDRFLRERVRAEIGFAGEVSTLSSGEGDLEDSCVMAVILLEKTIQPTESLWTSIDKG
jgi:hypothetical protein